MRVYLVTGGAGFIGSHFVDFVLGSRPEDRVVVLDALTYAGRRENLAGWRDDARCTFVLGDLRDRELLTDLFRRFDFDRVVHFAAETHVDRSIADPEAFIQSNVLGTFRLLETLRAHGWGGDTRRRFVQISTDEVYGTLAAEGRFREDTPYAPRSPYSASKAAADHLVSAAYHTYGLSMLVVHGSNNFGPRQFPEKLIPLVVQRCLDFKEIPVYGTGANVRDWIYVLDFCSAVDLVLERGRIGERYNVGADNQIANIDLVRRLCDIVDRESPGSVARASLIRFVEDRPGHDFRYAIDTGKLRGELGWTPVRSFDQALLETVRWMIAERKPSA